MEHTTPVQPNQSIPQKLSKNQVKNITVKNSPACSDNEKIRTNNIELKTKLKNITEKNTLANLSIEVITNDKIVKKIANNKSSSELSNNPQRKNAAFYFSDTLKTDVEEQKNVSNKTQLTENCQENCLNETELLHFGEDIQIDTDKDLVKEHCASDTSINLADNLKTKKNHDDSDLVSDVIYLYDESTKSQDPPLPDIPTDSDLLIIMDEDSFQSFVEKENAENTTQVMAEQFVSDKQFISSQSDLKKKHLNPNPDYLQVHNVDTNKDYVQNTLQTSSPSKFSKVKIIMDADSSFSSINDGDKPILMEFIEEKALDSPEQIMFTHIKEELSVAPNDEKLQKNLETENNRDLREIIQSRREKDLEFENESGLREVITQSRIQKNLAFENEPDLKEVIALSKREKNLEFENESDIREVITQSRIQKKLAFENEPDLREVIDLREMIAQSKRKKDLEFESDLTEVLTQSQREKNLEFENESDLSKLITQSRNEKNKLQMLPDLQPLTENQDMKLVKEESDQILEDNESLDMDIKTEIDEQNFHLTEELTPNELSTEQDIKPINIQTYATQLEFEDEIDNINGLSAFTEDKNKNIELKNKLSNNMSQSEPKSCENNKTDVTVFKNQSIDLNKSTIFQALSYMELSLVKPKRTRRGRRNRNKQTGNNSNIQMVHNDSAKGRNELNKEMVKSDSHTVLNDKKNYKYDERTSNNRSSIDKHKFTRYLQYDKYEVFGVRKSSMTGVENHNLKTNVKLNKNQETKDKVLNYDAISKEVKSIKNKSMNGEKRVCSDPNNYMLKQPNDVKNVNKSNASRKEIVEKSLSPSFRISKRKNPLSPESPIKRVKLVRPENTTNSIPRDHIHKTRDHIHKTRDHIHETRDHIHETRNHIHKTRDHTHETRDHIHKTKDQIHETRDHIQETRDHIHKTRDHIHKTRDHIHETRDHIQETRDHIHETRDHTHETRDHTDGTNYHIWDPRYQTPPVAKVAPRPRSPVRSPTYRPRSPARAPTYRPRSPVRAPTYRQRSWEQMWADMKMLQTRLVKAEDWKRQCDEELARWDKELDRCSQQLARIRAQRNLASVACEFTSADNSRCEYKKSDPIHKNRDVISVPAEEWKRHREEKELDSCNQELARIRARRNLALDAFAVSSANNSRSEYEQHDTRHKNRDVISVPAEEWTHQSQSEDKELDRCNQELAKIRVRRDLASDACAVTSANNSRSEYEQFDPRHKNRISGELKRQCDEQELASCNQELARIRARRNLALDAFSVSSANNSRSEYEQFDPRHKNRVVICEEEWKRQSDEKELDRCNQELAEIRVRRDLASDACDQQDPAPCLVRRRRRRTRTRKRKNHETIVSGDLTDPRLARVAVEERDQRCTLTQERQGQTEQANQGYLEDNRQSFRDLKITTNGRQRMIDPHEEKNINTNKISSQSILRNIEKGDMKSLLDIDP